MDRFNIRLGMAFIFAVILGSSNISQLAHAAKVTCPAEIKSGTMFPMTDASHTVWHNSNSINVNIDYKVVCDWKDVTPSKRKEGNVCTYSTFSNCSVTGTPAGTKFWLTDYKPTIPAASKKH